MGGIVSAVTNVVSSVAKSVGKVVQSVGKAVVSTVKGALSNPIGTIAKVAAISTGQLWALPIIDGAQVLANGGSLGDALKTGAISAVGSWAMAPSGLNLAGTFGQALGSETLGSVAAHSLRGGATAALTGGNFAEGALQGGLQAGVAGGVNALGVSDWIQNSALGGSLGAMGANVVGNALSGGIQGALSGRGVEQGISNSLTGNLFNWAGRGLSNVTSDVSNFLRNNDTQDQGLAAENQELTALNENISNTGSQLNQLATDFQENFENTQNAYNTYTEATEAYENAVGGARDELMATQTEFDAVANDYNSKYSEYTSLQQQYDDAVAAGNVDLANSLVPTLEAKIDEVNAVYGTYETLNTQLNDQFAALENLHNDNIDLYNTAQSSQQAYEQGAARIDELNQQGDTLNAQLLQDQERLTEEVQAYEQDLNRSSLERATSGATGNEQIFDDGSAITTFDDGSMLVRDAEGETFTYDSSGQLYTGSNTNTPAPQGTAPAGEASAWARMFQGMARTGAALGGAGGAGGARSNLAGGRGTPAQQGANALNQETDEEIAPAVEQNAPEQKDSDLFGFLDKGSKLTYIPGVTDALGFKPSEGTEYLTLGNTPIPAQQQLTGSPNNAADTTGMYGLDHLSFNEPDEVTPGSDSGYLDLSDPNAFLTISPYAEGGHVPEFYSEGGMRHVKGDGDGTSDEVPALLSSGEYVVPSLVVSMLGNGDNESGAGVLDKFVRAIREHKRSHDASELEPDSLGPLAYLQQSMKGA